MDDKKPIAIVAVVLAGLIGGGAWWYLRRSAVPANTTPAAVAATEAPIDRPAPPPVVLPPLDQMDDFLRPLLSALSARPELVRWMATDDLVRQLAFALDHASEGHSPARDFKVVAPRAPFQTARRGTTRTIDARSYQRYDSLVQTLTSIDASAAARVYKTIKPRLNEAYQGIGNPGKTVDQAMNETLDILLDTPVVQDPIEVVEVGGAAWAFADEELESLTSTQRQLLRMGPAHTDRVLVWLRAFKAAIE